MSWTISTNKPIPPSGLSDREVAYTLDALRLAADEGFQKPVLLCREEWVWVVRRLTALAAIESALVSSNDLSIKHSGKMGMVAGYLTGMVRSAFEYLRTDAEPKALYAIRNLATSRLGGDATTQRVDQRSEQGLANEAERLRNESAQEAARRRETELREVYEESYRLGRQLLDNTGRVTAVDPPRVSWWRALIGGQSVVDNLFMQLTASRAMLTAAKAANNSMLERMGEKASEVCLLRGNIELAKSEISRLREELASERSRSEALKRESAKARKKARRMWQSSLARKRQLVAEVEEVRRLRGLLVEAIAERNEARMAGRSAHADWQNIPWTESKS